LVRVDLHVHSSASFDCSVEPEQVAVTCRRLGLAPVFLTDHDSIEGALRLGATERVVVSQEVMTTAGELIGLFLNEQVPRGLTPTEAAARIKSQGGLIYLEHPYDPFRRHLSEDAIEALSDLIDIVEVFNGRSDAKANRQAEDLCGALGAVPGAGSDSHSTKELGTVYIEMEDFKGAEDFLVKLRAGKIVKRRPKLLLMAEAKLGLRIQRR
jgi:predicted metal-dependent phosphoesterase TrpH